jgi:CcmD family protein
MPALPIAEAVNGYVAAAYLVFFALVLSYVAIMGVRLARIEREVAELDELAAEQADEPAPEREQVTS